MRCSSSSSMANAVGPGRQPQPMETAKHCWLLHAPARGTALLQPLVQLMPHPGVVGMAPPHGKGLTSLVDSPAHSCPRSPQGEKMVTVLRAEESRQANSQHGLARTLLSNMVVGVDTGFTRTLNVRLLQLGRVEAVGVQGGVPDCACCRHCCCC